MSRRHLRSLAPSYSPQDSVGFPSRRNRALHLRESSTPRIHSLPPYHMVDRSGLYPAWRCFSTTNPVIVPCERATVASTGVFSWRSRQRGSTAARHALPGRPGARIATFTPVSRRQNPRVIERVFAAVPSCRLLGAQTQLLVVDAANYPSAVSNLRKVQHSSLTIALPTTGNRCSRFCPRER
jgi:hypothetical protein